MLMLMTVSMGLCFASALTAAKPKVQRDLACVDPKTDKQTLGVYVLPEHDPLRCAL